MDCWTHRGWFCENRKYIELYSHGSDIAAPRFWVTHYIEMTEERLQALAFGLDRYPAVRAWLERVRAQPGHVPITRG